MADPNGTLPHLPAPDGDIRRNLLVHPPSQSIRPVTGGGLAGGGGEGRVSQKKKPPRPPPRHTLLLSRTQFYKFNILGKQTASRAELC